MVGGGGGVVVVFFFFFFQAEDGIRDDLVTGVQTCALPIFSIQKMNTKIKQCKKREILVEHNALVSARHDMTAVEQNIFCMLVRHIEEKEIGRASCRERV